MILSPTSVNIIQLATLSAISLSPTDQQHAMIVIIFESLILSVLLCERHSITLVGAFKVHIDNLFFKERCADDKSRKRFGTFFHWTISESFLGGLLKYVCNLIRYLQSKSDHNKQTGVRLFDGHLARIPHLHPYHAPQFRIIGGDLCSFFVYCLK